MAAVQPRYGSHGQSRLFHDACRNGAAAMEPHMEMVAPLPLEQQHLPPFLDYSHRDEVGNNGRKMMRETEEPALPRLLSLQTPEGSPRHKMISLSQLQRRPGTTGLRLGADHAAVTSSSFLEDEIVTQFGDHYRNEMDRLIKEHAERLRRALADTRRRHSGSLLGAAEALAARRVREKEVEASRAARRGAELEERLAMLRAEAAAWRAKAMSEQSTAGALQARLQQAAAAAQARSSKDTNKDEDAADDAESGFVDPDRVVEVVAPPLDRPCRACRHRPACTVLLPCRHLCVCDMCEPAVSASAACPACRCPVTGAVQVFFS